MSNLITCNACGKQYSPRADSCPGCGEPNRIRICPDCGARCSRNAKSCPQCGAPFEAANPNNSNNPAGGINIVLNNANTNDNVSTNTNTSSAVVGTVESATVQGRHNKWVAFWLCFFLGWLGAHRFYEGKIFTGLVYFFTLGLCGFGVLIDLIIILTKSEYYD